jgi:myo-inositol-1(or 4)-monophosphatase
MMGACGLNHCHVATGRYDAFSEDGGPKIWDFAAGKLIVEEAGGVVCAVTGGAFDLMGRNSLAAATPELAAEMLEVLREVHKKNGRGTSC